MSIKNVVRFSTFMKKNAKDWKAIIKGLNEERTIELSEALSNNSVEHKIGFVHHGLFGKEYVILVREENFQPARKVFINSGLAKKGRGFSMPFGASFSQGDFGE